MSIGVHRLFSLAQGRQHVAQVVVVGGDGRRQGDGALQGGGGFGIPALERQHHAQEAVSVGMVGMLGDDGAAQGLGLGQAPRRLMGLSGLKARVHGARACSPVPVPRRRPTHQTLVPGTARSQGHWAVDLGRGGLTGTGVADFRALAAFSILGLRVSFKWRTTPF